MRTRILTLVTAGCALQGCGRLSADVGDARSDAQLLHAAVQDLTDIIVYDIFSPPVSSRVYAYSSVAGYEAARHDDPAARSLAGQLNGLRSMPAPQPGVKYHFPLAGVHALMTTGRALTFSRARMDSLRAAMHSEFRQKRIPSAVFDSSVAYGERVAQHILAWSKDDNYLQTRGMPKYTVTSERGRWVPTPPAYMDAVEPHWARIRPFALDSASQFPPRPPHPFDTAQGSAFFREASEVYELSKRLSEDQRQFVVFWDDNPYVIQVRGHTMFAMKKASPGGHWMGITAIAAKKARADVVKSAGAYARAAIALADGFISCWDEKFKSNVIRPETMINKYIDETWQPLLQTPPFPEYTSGHSVISAAAATVLTDEFGASFAFDDSTESTYGLPVRSFPSFEAAAAEAAVSRLYGGIHYRRAVEEGAAQGRRVGEHVVARVRTRGNLPSPRAVAFGR